MQSIDCHIMTLFSSQLSHLTHWPFFLIFPPCIWSVSFYSSCVLRNVYKPSLLVGKYTEYSRSCPSPSIRCSLTFNKKIAKQTYVPFLTFVLLEQICIAWIHAPLYVYVHVPCNTWNECERYQTHCKVFQHVSGYKNIPVHNNDNDLYIP